MTTTNDMVALSNCYDCREILKSKGGKFDATAKTWILTAEQFEAAEAEIEGLRDSTSKAKVAIVKSWDNAEGRWYASAPASETAPLTAKDETADKLQQIAHGVLSVDDAMNTDV